MGTIQTEILKPGIPDGGFSLVSTPRQIHGIAEFVEDRIGEAMEVRPLKRNEKKHLLAGMLEECLVAKLGPDEAETRIAMASIMRSRITRVNTACVVSGIPASEIGKSFEEAWGRRTSL